jgi:putative inorganic carbon (hco3(-)) transporter
MAWSWVVLAMPFLLFPAQIPHSGLVAAVLLAGPVVGAWCTRQAAWVNTPISTSLLLLAVMVAVSIYVSPFRDLSWPKFCSIVLGLAVLRAVLLAVRTRARLWAVAGAYIVSGLAVSGAGLLGAALSSNKLLPARLTALFPQRFTGVPGTEGFVNPNALGGTVLFFLPLGMALCGGLAVLLARRRRENLSEPHPGRPACGSTTWLGGAARGVPFRDAMRNWVPVALAALAALVLGLLAVLVLTQSRTAWISLAVTMAVMAAVRWRLWRWVAAASAVLFLAMALVRSGHDPVPDGIVQVPPSSTIASAAGLISLEARVEIWSRGIYGIEDFPFTGMGLNTFRRVVRALYPLSLVSPDVDVAHAHNIFLQTGLDLGVPGLVAYVALLLLASVMCWQIYQRAHGLETGLVLGLWGNLVAVHVFGLADAISLGAKVGLFFWWNLGLISAFHRCVSGAANELP